MGVASLGQPGAVGALVCADCVLPSSHTRLTLMLLLQWLATAVLLAYAYFLNCS